MRYYPLGDEEKFSKGKEYAIHIRCYDGNDDSRYVSPEVLCDWGVPEAISMRCYRDHAPSTFMNLTFARRIVSLRENPCDAQLDCRRKVFRSLYEFCMT